MTDTTMPNNESNAGTDGTTAPDEFKPITSQDDLNRIIAERVSRERAKYADYKDLQSKAQQFDALAEANKSEIEKANDKAAAAERERDAARAEVLRFKVASQHGISPEDADLFLTGSDEATLTKQAERLTARDADRKKVGNISPREGNTPSTAANDDERAFVRNLFASAD